MFSSALPPRSSGERQKAEYGRGFTTEAQGKAKVRGLPEFLRDEEPPNQGRSDS